MTIAFGWCESGAGRVRAVRAWTPRPARILVITAHPDDELLLAPFLGPRCVREGSSCAIVVFTAPNEVRTGEMALAAAMLNLRLTQWSYPDVMSDFAAAWGDRQTLVRQLRDIIATEQPEMILTFDPAHGTTGHPAHREVGSLVVETGAANIHFLETTAQFVGDGFVLSHARPDAWPITGDWDFAVRDAEIHASQFSPAQVESLRNLPPEQKIVWIWRPT